MSNEIDFDGARIFAIPMRARFRGITVREGMLIEGPFGWGEFCPFADYDDTVSASWLATTIEQCTLGWPEPVRARIPINCTVPAVGPERAYEVTAHSGCRTAKVKVADHPESLAEDLARVEAVRAALGPDGAIRVDANGVWDTDTAVSHIRQLDKAASGLEYVEQPCHTIEELAAVRRQVEVRIAADESIRRAEDPLRVAVAGAADIAVIKCTPLGGVRRSLQVAEAAGLPCVVSSALETSVGLAAQVALAAALPDLAFACGLGTLSLLDSDIVSGPDSLSAVDGYLPVPRTPPAPDLSLLDTYELADPEQSAWWRDRLTRVRAIHDTHHTGLPSRHERFAGHFAEGQVRSCRGRASIRRRAMPTSSHPVMQMAISASHGHTGPSDSRLVNSSGATTVAVPQESWCVPR
ncbi:O-succinylbenzoate synthase [Amycolatopsis cihanbeyliensis]|uniref:o-succinylbenzoate synthase n=1 Tax=Amycolatopsis cihanbeyliensis TaxID=1128664 RepID=A0A542DFD9_AMYCI|nr:O-succinylbenzoate synthase [Amycolatopsis cihanbeyliensis]